MRKILEKLMMSKSICAIYSDVQNTNKFSVGFIKYIDEESYILDCIDQYGFQDGLLYKRINEVFKVEESSKYCNNIENLFMFHKQKEYEGLEFEDSCINTLLDYAKNNEKICSIETVESGFDDVVGYITNAEDNLVEISNVSIDGENNGINHIYIEDISFVSCDSKDEKKIKSLNKINLEMF